MRRFGLPSGSPFSLQDSRAGSMVKSFPSTTRKGDALTMTTTASRWHLAGALSLAALLAACVTVPAEVPGPPRKESIVAVTAQHELIRFNAGQPQKVLQRQRITGLQGGEALVGIDYRIARGVLFGLSDQGRLYTLDLATGAARQVGTVPAALPLAGPLFGFDFNPAADRIRVVGNAGQNLRLHPDTGAVVDGDAAQPGLQGDPTLHYAPGDMHAGKPPAVVAAAYTYNKQDETITTNYAIDRRWGTLVMQGSKEGTTPVVSPNTGRLFTVGALGMGELGDAAFDIADVTGAAFAALRPLSGGRTQLVLIDLASGRAERIGTVADGAPLRGLAIEP